MAKALLILAACCIGQRASAQYTGEFIICIDGSSVDACRNTAIPPENNGSVIWFRDYGSTLCVGVGIVPQKTDCSFRGDSNLGFDCGRRQDSFFALVRAGDDLAISCGLVSPLPDGNYSAGTTSNTCFDELFLCQNFILTR